MRAATWILGGAFAALVVILLSGSSAAADDVADAPSETPVTDLVDGLAGSVTKPLTDGLAPATDPVTKPVEKTLAPVTKPVAKAVERVAKPVTDPVVKAVATPLEDVNREVVAPVAEKVGAGLAPAKDRAEADAPDTPEVAAPAPAPSDVDMTPQSEPSTPKVTAEDQQDDVLSAATAAVPAPDADDVAPVADAEQAPLDIADLDFGDRTPEPMAPTAPWHHEAPATGSVSTVVAPTGISEHPDWSVGDDRLAAVLPDRDSSGQDQHHTRPDVSPG